MKKSNHLFTRNKTYYFRFSNQIFDVRLSLETKDFYEACYLRDKMLNNLPRFFMSKNDSFKIKNGEQIREQAKKIIEREKYRSNGNLDTSGIQIEHYIPKNKIIKDQEYFEDCLKRRIIELEQARVRNGGKLPDYMIDELKLWTDPEILHESFDENTIELLDCSAFTSYLDGKEYIPKDNVELFVSLKEAMFNISIEYLTQHHSTPVTSANKEKYNKLVELGIIQPANNDIVQNRMQQDEEIVIKQYSKKPEQQVTVKQVVDEYIQEKKLSSDTSPNTLNDAIKMLNLAMEFFSETISINEANTRSLLLEYKEALKKLPQNRNKGKYKGKNIKALAKMNITESGLSVATTNKYLMYLTSLFKYAEEREYITKSQAYRLQDKNKVHPRDQNDRFASDEIVILFSKLKELYGKGNKQEKLWIPLISLFTSCRLNEVCQMTFADLLKKDNIWCFSITTEEDEKNRSLKTVYSHRTLPVHQTLIKLGLIEYIQKQAKKHKADANMWELKYEDSRNKYGRTVSRTFNDLSKKLLNAPTRRKTFHSLRHNFASRFRQVADNELVLYFDGHSSGSQTFSRYVKYDDYKWLKSEIDKLIYPKEVDQLFKSWMKE